MRSNRIVVAGTLGKALGVPVAFVAGPKSSIDRIRRASGAFVHSSPPSIPNVAAALEALRLNEVEGDWRRLRLAYLVRRFQRGSMRSGVRTISNGSFPIQTIRYPSVHAAHEAAKLLFQRGIWPILQLDTRRHTGSAVLRFLITALHETCDIDRAVKAISARIRIA